MKPGRRSVREIGQGLARNPRLRRWISLGVMLVTLLFFAVLLIQGRDELRQLGDWRNYVRAMVIGFCLYPISLVIHAWIWSRMIARLGRSKSGWWDLEIYTYTHLVRRLPGAVWYLATRSLMYYERGVKTSATLVASGLEWLWLLLAGLVVYGLFSLPGVAPGLLGLAVVGGLWMVGQHGPRLVRSLSHWKYMPALGQRGLAQIDRVNLPTGVDLVIWLVAYALTYGVAGAIFYTLIHSVAPGAPITIHEAIRIWALVTSVGTLVTGILPAGLGVNELTITALLAPKITVVSSLFVAILVRLLFIVCDLAWGGLLWGLARLGARRSAQVRSLEVTDEAGVSNSHPVPDSADE